MSQKKRQKRGNGYEGAKGWNHPSHRNGATSGISNISYGGGSQNSGNGQPMNPIDTEWPLILTPDNVATTCTINPLDWYRRRSSSFGDPVMPMLESEWKTDGPDAIRLRGRKAKYGKWASHVQQFKFKVRIEATDPENPRKRIVSSISPETLVLFPKLGVFGASGQTFEESNPATHARWFFGFGLKFLQ